MEEQKCKMIFLGVGTSGNDAHMTHGGIQVLRVLEPALRMKAQADSSSRGRKDFICREEKRKTAWWCVQGDPETGGPRGQVGDGVFIAFLSIA
jgi:hypothetical protein